jgi:hypothetical protein
VANLRVGESGGVFCPKLGADIDPEPHNLGGCHHCVFRLGPMVRDQAGHVGVTCGLVPRIKFCRRQLFLEDGSWACTKPPTGLDEYRRITGDLTSAQVPEGFLVPRPTTLTLCLACAVQGRTEYQPTVKLEVVTRALQDACSPARRATYPPPASEAAAQMRRALMQINPAWPNAAAPAPTAAKDMSAQALESGAVTEAPPRPRGVVTLPSTAQALDAPPPIVRERA